MRIIHWFRSDLRVDDNRALDAASRAADELLPVFVLDPGLVAACAQDKMRLGFLRASLVALDGELRARGSRLHIVHGEPVDVLPALTSSLRADQVVWNADYSPAANARDAAVRSRLEGSGARVSIAKDRVVWDATEVRTKAGGPYTVYSPYRRAWLTRYHEARDSCGTTPAVARFPPCPSPGTDALSGPTYDLVQRSFSDLGPDELSRVLAGLPACSAIPAGEQVAKDRLSTFLAGPAATYDEHRDRPDLPGTSRLSPYLRFGVISVRQCVEAAQLARAQGERVRVGIDKWLDELVWRDFYHAILAEFPHVTRRNFRPQYDALRWENDPEWFRAWCEGRTGYPMVDAAMRELNATGWMHNRARMIVASFLTKDLLVDWRWGERYFKKMLIDWDPASNNGGWQWAASTGTDAQPYFRIFNPTTQGERFDPNGDYVRQWIPELASLAGKSAHQPSRAGVSPDVYPNPIVDHAVQRQRALAMFQDAKAMGAVPS